MTSQSDDTKQNKDAVLAAELAPLRTQIDAIDNQLLALLSDRAKVAQEVGEVKKRYSSPAFRPDRELQVIRKMQSGNPGPLHDESIAAHGPLRRDLVEWLDKARSAGLDDESIEALFRDALQDDVRQGVA